MPLHSRLLQPAVRQFHRWRLISVCRGVCCRMMSQTPSSNVVDAAFYVVSDSSKIHRFDVTTGTSQLLASISSGLVSSIDFDLTSSQVFYSNNISNTISVTGKCAFRALARGSGLFSARVEALYREKARLKNSGCVRTMNWGLARVAEFF